MSGALITAKTVESLVESRKDKIAPLLGNVNIEQFQSAFLVAFSQNRKLAQCSKASIVGAMYKCAEWGLKPGLGNVWLIPYGTSCNVQIGYKGLMELAHRTGKISSINHAIVREGDHFVYKVVNGKVVFEYEPNLMTDGEPKLYIAWTTIKETGEVVLGYVNRAKVDKLRGVSQSSNSPAWSKFYDEMAITKAIKNLVTRLDLSSNRISDAVHLDSQLDAGLSQNLDRNLSVHEELTAEMQQEVQASLDRSFQPRSQLFSSRPDHTRAVEPNREVDDQVTSTSHQSTEPSARFQGDLIKVMRQHLGLR